MYYSYNGLLRHLIGYRGERITFKHVTKDFCIGFNEYLKTAKNGTYRGKIIAKSTQHQYSNLLTSTLYRAIEIVSKLLGHGDIKTTQIYAKVIDQNKRAAVSRLDGLMG